MSTTTRATLLKSAQDTAAKAKAENRDLTESEAAQIESAVAEIKALDAEGSNVAALVQSIGGMDGWTTDAKSGTSNRDGSTGEAGSISLHGLADRITAGMKAYSLGHGRTKGLVPSGETVVDLPLVNRDAIKGDASHERPPRLIDVIPGAGRSAPHYSFLKQSVIASPGGAGVVAAGAVKPTKKLGVERVDSRLRVVAVLSEGIDKYLLEDASSLRTWVGTELAEAVQTELESQVLAGDGTGENFTGLSTITGHQTQAFQTDPLVTLRYGLSDLETLGITPSFVALSAADWLTIQTTRNTGGGFDVGGPIDTTARTAWGTQVVVVPGLAAGTGWVVGQDSLTLSTDNHGVRVEWGTPGDTFTRNQLVARVEGRFNLDVLRPHGLVEMTLTDA
ncbi:hypothetical protein GCM10009718_02560 [Isoptericola halotolerans]|uniref:Phage capsid-like C-terminal domain-containing protein n=1 Tax=Isoptericola halotolerans TaxID=300560 RepID=A0ABX2A293_9MICO|nr:phage major capsid protein [Isoptericola halotolerans]NOV96816.1 hypothetical protein [Isoptericola halotolerans]